MSDIQMIYPSTPVAADTPEPWLYTKEDSPSEGETVLIVTINDEYDFAKYSDKTFYSLRTGCVIRDIVAFMYITRPNRLQQLIELREALF